MSVRPGYPVVARSSEVEVLHGRRLDDPFRALEGQDNALADAWVAANQTITDDFLAAGREQAAIGAWLERFLGHDHVFHTIDAGSRRFMLESRPGSEQPVILAADPDTPARLVVELAPGRVLLQDAVYPSPKGKWLAYAEKSGLRDFARLRLVAAREGYASTDPEFPETIMPCVSWLADETGFYYNQNQGQFLPDGAHTPRPDGIYFHRVGTAPSDDRLVFAMSSGEAHVAVPSLVASGRVLFVNLVQLVTGAGELWAIPLGTGAGERPILLGKAGFCLIGEWGNRVLFETDLDAPNGRVVAFDIAGPISPQPIEVVAPQMQPLVRTTASVRAHRSALADDRLVLTYLNGAGHRVAVFDLDGRHVRDLSLPAASAVAGPGGNHFGRLGIARDGRLILDLWTFARLPLSWLYDLRDDSIQPVATKVFSPGLDGVLIEHRFFPASDGTPIPITLLSLAPLPVDGSAPCLLYGYGAAGTPIVPEFALDAVGWLAIGGVWALANVRGGGEYGKAWHEAARGPAKPVSFDDFCDAARWLIERGITRPGRLAIRGVSYGGLLVGAAMTRHPELFGAVIAEIPLLDPLRIGQDYWSAQLAPELGNPTQDAAAFDCIAGYSPLGNIVPGCTYPPSLVVLADGDAALLTDGGRKFVATLQSDPAHGGPHLLHLLRGAAHGGWSRTQQIDVVSRELAFLVKALGMTLDLGE